MVGFYLQEAGRGSLAIRKGCPATTGRREACGILLLILLYHSFYIKSRHKLGDFSELVYNFMKYTFFFLLMVRSSQSSSIAI